MTHISTFSPVHKILLFFFKFKLLLLFFFKFLTSQTVHGCDDGRVPIKVILSSPRLAQIEGVASVGPLPVRLDDVLDREEFRLVCCYLQRKHTKQTKKRTIHELLSCRFSVTWCYYYLNSNECCFSLSTFQ